MKFSYNTLMPVSFWAAVKGLEKSVCADKAFGEIGAAEFFGADGALLDGACMNSPLPI